LLLASLAWATPSSAAELPLSCHLQGDVSGPYSEGMFFDRTDTYFFNGSGTCSGAFDGLAITETPVEISASETHAGTLCIFDPWPQLDGFLSLPELNRSLEIGVEASALGITNPAVVGGQGPDSGTAAGTLTVEPQGWFPGFGACNYSGVSTFALDWDASAPPCDVEEKCARNVPPLYLYHALEYTGDPAAGGKLLTEQWASPVTGDSRTEDGETTTTRSTVPCEPGARTGIQCVQMRQLTELDAAADQYAYVVYTGASENDPRIGGQAWILEPAAFEGPPVASGPLSDVVGGWQSPPPGHGPEYELYEFTRSEMIDPVESEDEAAAGENPVELTERVWIDATTRLPLKTETVAPTESLGATFFTYEQPQELPTDLFAVGPAPHVVLDKEVTLVGAQDVGWQVDEQTGLDFQPYHLGNQPVIAGQSYCLATSDIVHMDEEIDPTPPGDVAEDPENALDPYAAAVQTSVSASYNPVGPGEECVPGTGSLMDPSLQVISEHRSSPDAMGWRQTYAQAANGIEHDPTADPASGGVMTVTVDGEAETAYAVADVGTTDMSVLIAGRTTQVTISGDFDKDEIQAVANLLEPQ
jgi:hypothetical protein